MDVMKVLGDHGLFGSSAPYYSIAARRVYYQYSLTDGTDARDFIEMLDDGGVIFLDKASRSLVRLNNQLRLVYSVSLGSTSAKGVSLALNRSESMVYVLIAGVLTKRRISDGGVVWTKTLTQYETDICVNATGVYVLDHDSSSLSFIDKLSLTDGSVVWSATISGKANYLQVNDAGEVFTNGYTSIYKISPTGTVTKIREDGRVKPDQYWIWPGGGYIFTKYISAMAYYTFSGVGPTEMIGSASPDLDVGGSGTGYGVIWAALGSSNLFVLSSQGEAYVFRRSDFTLVDRVGCNGQLIAASPGKDDFVVWNNRTKMFTIYKK